MTNKPIHARPQTAPHLCRLDAVAIHEMHQWMSAESPLMSMLHRLFLKKKRCCLWMTDLPCIASQLQTVSPPPSSSGLFTTTPPPMQSLTSNSNPVIPLPLGPRFHWGQHGVSPKSSPAGSPLPPFPTNPALPCLLRHREGVTLSHPQRTLSEGLEPHSSVRASW